MVALGDVEAGIGGIIFAAVLGLLAQLQSVLLSVLVLAALNAVAAYLALSMQEKSKPQPD